MLLAAAVLVSAVLQLESSKDLDPGTSTELVEAVREAVSEVSGCEYELRDCGVADCRLDTKTDTLTLKLLGGVRRVSVSLTRGSEQRDEIWPLESRERWKELARALALEVNLGKTCAVETSATMIPTSSPGSSDGLLTQSLLAASVLCTAGALVSFSLTQAPVAEIPRLSGYGPALEDLRSEVEIKRTIGGVFIGAALSFAALAIWNEL